MVLHPQPEAILTVIVPGTFFSHALVSVVTSTSPLDVDSYWARYVTLDSVSGKLAY